MYERVIRALSAAALALVSVSAFSGGTPVTETLISGPRNADPLELVTVDLSWQGGTPPFQVELDYGQNNAPLVLPTTGPTTQNSVSWSWRNFDPGFVTVRATLIDGEDTRVPFEAHYMVFRTEGPYYVHDYPYVEFDGVDCFSNRSRQESFSLNPEFDLMESFIEIVGESDAGGPVINWRNEQAPTPPFFIDAVEVFEHLAPPPSGPLYYGIRERFSAEGLLPPLAYGDYDIPDTLQLADSLDPAPALASGEEYRIRMTTSDGGCVGSTAEMVLERNPPALGVADGEVGLVSESDGFEFNGLFLPPRVETRLETAARLGVKSEVLVFCRAVAVRLAIGAASSRLEELEERCANDNRLCSHHVDEAWCDQAAYSCSAVERFKEKIAWRLLFSDNSILEANQLCLEHYTETSLSAAKTHSTEPIVIEAPLGVGQLSMEPGVNTVVRGSFAEAALPDGGTVEVWELVDPPVATEFAAPDGPVQITPYATPDAPIMLESRFRILVLETGETALLPPDMLFADGFEQSASVLR
ncbi:MAG: hypothetical protein R3200_15330 [Xanthomonadales bacterium]|nr:hypothetical protein [Xanthomonadales bacterium]